MFYLVFVFSATFTVFIVLIVCLSVKYFVYDFIINKLMNILTAASIIDNFQLPVYTDRRFA